MTQPAVSRLILDMETFYGVQLFERINHRLYPTEAAHRMYSHAIQILAGMEALNADMHSGNETFTIQVGATYSMGCFIMPQVVAKFRQIYPRASLKVQVFNAGLLKERLLHGTLDFALIEDFIADPQLENDIFFEDEMVIVLAPHHPLAGRKDLTIQDLAKLEMLVRDRGSNGRRIVDEVFAQHGVSYEPLMESASTQAILYGVKAGLGGALLPLHLVSHMVNSGEVIIRRLSDQRFERKNCLMWHKQKVLNEPMRRTMELCRETAAELLHT